MIAKTAPRNRFARFTAPLTLLIVLLAAAALLGGSSRADTATLILLRPLALALAVVAVARLTRHEWARFGGYLAIAAAAVVLVAAHLIPLPPGLWSALPGREIVVAIDRAAGLGAVWRPLSLDPWMGTNTLLSLSVPVAALALATQLDARGRQRVLAAIIVIGLLSAALGVLQFAGGAGSALFYYRVSNNGSAIGLLANRNHQGVFLGALFPLIAAYACVAFGRTAKRRHDGRAGGDPRRWSAAVVAAMILPVVFAASSRAGLASTAIGLTGAMLVAWPHYLAAARAARVPGVRHQTLAARPWFRGMLIAIAAFGFVVFAATAVGLSSGNALDRLLADSNADPELRWPVWQVTWHTAMQYLPLGSGAGSFVRVFQVVEPHALLSPLYLNHAHNDFLEMLLEFGIAAPVLVVAAGYLLLRDAWRVWRADGTSAAVTIARASTVVLGQFAFGSLFDYPLRTPMLAAIAAVLVVLLRFGASERPAAPTH
jgi:O-antigen ligase